MCQIYKLNINFQTIMQNQDLTKPAECLQMKTALNSTLPLASLRSLLSFGLLAPIERVVHNECTSHGHNYVIMDVLGGGGGPSGRRADWNKQKNYLKYKMFNIYFPSFGINFILISQSITEKMNIKWILYIYRHKLFLILFNLFSTRKSIEIIKIYLPIIIWHSYLRWANMDQYRDGSISVRMARIWVDKLGEQLLSSIFLIHIHNILRYLQRQLARLVRAQGYIFSQLYL